MQSGVAALTAGAWTNVACLLAVSLRARGGGGGDGRRFLAEAGRAAVLAVAVLFVARGIWGELPAAPRDTLSVATISAVVAGDAAHWAVHRALHTRAAKRWFNVHAVHHATEGTLTYLDAVHVHAAEAVVVNAALYGVPAALGAGPIANAAWAAVNAAFNFYIHSGSTDTAREAGAKAGLLSTPGTHQAHHDVYTANYGNFLTVWDRVAGTLA